MLGVEVVVHFLAAPAGLGELVGVEKAATLTEVVLLVQMDWVAEEVVEHMETLMEGMAGLE